MPITLAAITMPMDGAHGDSGAEDTLHYAGYKIEQFSADASTVDGVASKKIVDWRWTADDGWTDKGRHVQHRFDTPGTHVVTCNMTADDGATATAIRSVTSTTPSLVMDTYHKAAGLDSDTGADDAHAYSSWERSQYRWREGDITHSKGTPGRLRTKSGETISYTANADDTTPPRHYHDPDFGPLIYDTYGGAPRANVHFASTKELAFLADHHVPDEWGWSVYFRSLRFYKDAQEDTLVGSNIPGSQFDDCLLENGGTVFQGNDTAGNVERAFVGGGISGSATTGLHAAMAWLAVDGATIANNGLAGEDAEHQIYGTDITHGCFRRLVVVGSNEANDGVRCVSSHYVYVADVDVSGIWNAGASFYPGSNGTSYNASTHWLGERLKAHDNHESACAIDFNHNDDSLLRNFLFYGPGPVAIVIRGYDASHKANDTRIYHGVSHGSTTPCFTIDTHATATKIRNTIFMRTDANPFFTVVDAADVDMDYCCFWRVGATDDPIVANQDDANFCVVNGVTKTYKQWKLLAPGNDSHSIFRDPKFTNAAAADFTLQVTSPCIGAGVPLGEVPRDFLDIVRAGFTTIGAYHPADSTPPTVAITSPSEGATVAGTIPILATASDAVGVAGVQFKLDGVALGFEVTVGPYSFSWNTASVPNGAHTLAATARDASGNSATSAVVNITVNNPSAGAPPPGGHGGLFLLATGIAQTRKVIRQGVRRLLLGTTAAGSRVFANRTEALQHTRDGGELPALLVRTPTEPAELACQAPPVYRRRLRIAIEVIVHRNEGFEAGLDAVGEPLGETETEELDRITRDVEQLLLADPTLEQTVGYRAADDCDYVDTIFDFEDRAEQVIGSALVEFDYTYQTQIQERGVAEAVDAERMHVDHQPIPPGDRILTTDDIELPVT